MLFVITGPSGCGKSTLIKKVRRALGDLEFSVSHTTRPRRPSEKDGVDYHFVSERDFRRMVREERFLEHACVHGHLYGTSRAEVAKKGRRRDLLLDIDVQGARQVRRRAPGAVHVFIMPPVAAELRRRLVKRREDGPEAVERRLRDARAEVRAYGEFDFVIVNDDLGRAAADLEAVIVASRRRPAAMAGALRPILRSFGPELFTNRGGPRMRGLRGEAVLFSTANPENEAEGAESFRPEGKNALLRVRRRRKGILMNKAGEKGRP
jgi:guanylate kinase